MKKEIGLVLVGIFFGLVIAGYFWLHFRVRGLENFVNQLIINSRQQQAQVIPRLQPQPVQ